MSPTHKRKSCMKDQEVFWTILISSFLHDQCALHHFLCFPPPFVNLGTRFLLMGRAVTRRITKILIKLLKMQLSLMARADQVVEVANQDLNYQDFKFEVSKCCLVWTDILSQQIFRIDWSRIRPCSQKRSCFPWLVLQVWKSAEIMEVSTYLFQGSKQS
jgi:hypothetical protein